MVRKVLDAIAVLAFLLSASITGGVYFGYKYITSPQFELKIKNKLMGDLNKAMPQAIDQKMPKMTGVALPL